MTKNLNNSQIDRQNILNNPFALSELENQIQLKGVIFESKIWFTTKQVAEYFDVDLRTIQRNLDKNDQELRLNGYKVFTGEALEQMKKYTLSDTNVVKNAPSIGMFDFRSFLNIGMLLESQKAKELRNLILDIVIGVMNKKYGENRKYINQNDPLYNFAINEYQGYHKLLTEVLSKYVDMSNNKYPYFNDKIYQFLFLERYKEYKSLLELKSKERPISTHYAEVITTISTFETAFAEEIELKFVNNKIKLKKEIVESIFDNLIQKKLWQPLLGFTREIIASRDMVFREILHPNLAKFVRPLGIEEYQKFIGENQLQGPDLSIQEKKQIEEIKTQNLFEEFETPILRDIFIRMNEK